MHQSVSLQIYGGSTSQDSQHDDGVLHLWAKNRTTRKFQRNQANKSPSNLHFL